MYPVELTDEEVKKIEDYVEQRFQYSEIRSIPSFKDFSGRGVNPNILGIFVECAVRKPLGYTVEETLKSRIYGASDPGYDVEVGGRTFDIKGKSAYYHQQFIEEKGKSPYGYIVAYSVTKRSYIVIGWITRECAIVMGTLHRKGEVKTSNFTYPCDTREVKNIYFHPFKALVDMPRTKAPNPAS